jgi:toxin FitB
MIVLDTNVVSALMRNVPDPSVEAWLDHQPNESLWTTAVTVLEIETGLQTMPHGKKRSSLSHDFEKLLDQIDHRIAMFDEAAARLSAELTGKRQRRGKIVELRDTMIAGIVLSHRASLATRNTSHFDDISATVINPWSV